MTSFKLFTSRVSVNLSRPALGRSARVSSFGVLGEYAECISLYSIAGGGPSDGIIFPQNCVKFLTLSPTTLSTANVHPSEIFGQSFSSPSKIGLNG